MIVLLFYLAAFIYSWSIWILGITVFKNAIDPYVLVSIGGLGPVAGLAVYLKLLNNKGKIKEYIKRCTNVRDVKASVWMIAILLPFAVIWFSNFLAFLLSNSDPRIFELDKGFLASGSFYPFFLLFFGPIPEELAWRGVAFEELLNRLDYFRAQIIVAILWAAWHIPLFFIYGSYQNALGIFTPAFWMFFINVILNSFLTGWIYVKSGRSILRVCLATAHF